MSDYTELVKALRCKRDDCEGCDIAFLDNDEGWICQYAAKDDDAADAIEALNRLLDQNTQRCEALRKQLREAHESYERHLNELEAQLPKRGKWIEENRRPRSSQFVCSECHRTAYDPQPTRDKAWRKRCRYAYCPNCGADMRAKMEVSE